MLATIALSAAGCRDAPAPFDAGSPEFRTDGRDWQLTYSVKNDRSPVWSAGGDSLYYSAESYGQWPATPGILLTVPRDGGVARPILSNVQVGGATRHWLTAPAVSPSGTRVAFADVWNVWARPLCHLDSQCAGPALEADPRLETVFLRVREYGAAGPMTGGPAVRIDFQGRQFDAGEPTEGLAGIYRVRMHPFQRLWGDGFIFRPSWSPDGRRIAYSDGLRILIWDVDGGAPPVPVANTADGVWPAWSPDGQWLAFARLERGDSAKVRCSCYADMGGLVLVEERTVYTGTGATVTLIRPDGTGRRDLAPGQEPAWSPDGSKVYFRNEDRIWTVSANGGTPVQVQGTAGGREPAVSPDGKLLAFARRNNRGVYNLWVTRLD